MKKILTIAVVLAFAFTATWVNAQERYVGGGFEMSGHVVTGLGYQHNNNKTGTEVANDGDRTTYPGPIGAYLGKLGPLGTPEGGNDNVSFFVDQIELDIMKSFGENVRLRADLDFGRINSSGIGSQAFVLEQAYATANIPVGNGIEFLLGRFNTPMGFESVDVAANDLISKSIITRALRPVNNTGMKIYYAFSDLVDFHFYVVNTLMQDTINRGNTLPAFGMRLGFNWGEEGTESTFGISGFMGPDNIDTNKNLSFGGDVDLNWWITESFALGLEGLFRRDNSVTRGKTVAAGQNTMYMGGLLNLHYVFSDVWDGTLRYTFAKQFQGGTTAAAAAGSIYNLTGAQQSIHEITLGGAYAIADGAKFKLEGRFDIVKPSQAIRAVAGFGTEYVYGAVAGFVYDF